MVAEIDRESNEFDGLEPALDQRLEQARRDGRVLGWAFAKTQHVLPPGRIDAHRRQHVVEYQTQQRLKSFDDRIGKIENRLKATNELLERIAIALETANSLR